MVRLVLSRKFFSIFMKTYLPTILTNIVNQATNYINGDDKYNMIITYITYMVVLASVYLAVSVSLPSTVNIKLEVPLEPRIPCPRHHCQCTTAAEFIFNVISLGALQFQSPINFLYFWDRGL